MRNGEPLEFDVPGLRLQAKQWGSPTGRPTLALHGWLDNANTFDRLAPLLPELNLVALDFAGHGLSDHRAAGVHYHSLWDIQDTLAVANQLGWQQFSLIGHSMGAGIASELAGMFPERVEQAVMIDGFLATGGVTLDERVAQNREAVEKMLRLSPTATDASTQGPKLYPDLETMARRVTQATDQSMAASRVLVERGHKAVEGGVTWRTDPRIRFPTPLRMHMEQINLLVQASTSKALLLVAEQGDKWYQGEVALRQEHHPNLTVHRMDGPHHIHLEPKYVERVAEEIRGFLSL